MPLPLLARVLWPSARSDAPSLLTAGILGLAGAALALARPWPLAFAIDGAIGGRALLGLSARSLLILAAVGVVVLTGAGALLDMTSVVLAERTAERIGARVRQQMFDRSVSLSLRWHDRVRSGELMSRFSTDVGRLLDVLVATCSTVFADVAALSAVLAVLFLFSPALGLVAVAVVPVLAGFAIRQRRLVRRVQHDARAESGRLAGATVDLLRNVRAVQAFGRESRSAALFGARNRAVLDVNLRAVTIEARWAPVADVVLAAGSGLVLIVGGTQVIDGLISTGDLVVVMSYLAALYSPVRSLSRLGGLWAKASASAVRIDEVLSCQDRVLDRPGALAAPAVPAEVRFENVHFGYRPGSPVLSGFDLTVPAGQKLCLLGPSGTGKTTVLQLLLRLYDVDAGSIRVGGVELRDLALSSLRERIAFVPQDPWLFDASVADNIAFGSSRATWHGIRHAGRTALVDEFVDRLPDGYDTVIGEGGSQLSGGQRRRIALARAAMSGAPLVLLDEPTASLDHISAAAVIESIRNSTAGRTVLVVTHDRDLAAFADRVLVLDPHGATDARAAAVFATSSERR